MPRISRSSAEVLLLLSQIGLSLAQDSDGDRPSLPLRPDPDDPEGENIDSILVGDSTAASTTSPSSASASTSDAASASASATDDSDSPSAASSTLASSFITSTIRAGSSLAAGTATAASSGLIAAPSAATTSSAAASGSDGSDGSDDSGDADKHQQKLAIIIGSVLGFVAILLFCAVVWLGWRKQRKGRFFPGRSVTPLDDSVFESWRKPTRGNDHREEKDGMLRPSDAGSSRYARSRPLLTGDSRSPMLNGAAAPGENPFENPFESQLYAYRSNSTRGSRHSRAKSSLSIYDRPPTPFSPTRASDEQLGAVGGGGAGAIGAGAGAAALSSSPKGGSPKQQHTPAMPKSPSRAKLPMQLPSLTDVSDFDFGFYANDWIPAHPTSSTRSLPRMNGSVSDVSG
ncbi:hypothetical protein BDY21DRAFT_361075 [Lineolata rhizophorae]|uniref:Mid2 domain-containing protein n=1 Tax=Lineolata rhizophorae TaxID=578093 RepID=A0A6A6PAV4_9PEZI|nr:hypothetical protein BDY21DRAFT_361075 [Lineolata rhizophorae]